MTSTTPSGTTPSGSMPSRRTLSRASLTKTSACLLLVLACATTAAAREVRSGDTDGAACQDSPHAASHAPAAATVPAATTPSRETRIKPSVHGDAAAGSQLQAPRWHSFLPGMFR